MRSKSPVQLQASATSVARGVALADAGDDFIVFGNGIVELIDDGALILAPVAFHLRLDRPVQRE